MNSVLYTRSSAGTWRTAWRGMGSENRRWLVVNSIFGTAAINLLVGGGLGWLNALGLKHVAVWSVPLVGRTSVFTDAIGTFFFLPLVTCLLTTFAVRVEQRRRALPLVAPFAAWRRLPTHPLRRGFAMGAVCFIGLSPIAALVLAIARVGEMSPSVFALYAAGLSVALGLVVTPVVALLAMADPMSSRTDR